MKITNVRIENFKSIKKMEIPFDKVGNSYTKIFVGVNEVISWRTYLISMYQKTKYLLTNFAIKKWQIVNFVICTFLWILKMGKRKHCAKQLMTLLIQKLRLSSLF